MESLPQNPYLAYTPNLSFTTIPRFTLESKATLRNVPISYMASGQLNPAGDNVIVLCHPFIGHGDFSQWWAPLIGSGRALDTDRYFVVCFTALGSPYGSASPMTWIDGNPSKGRYGPDFPMTSVRDDVRVHRLALQSLGAQRVFAVIGGSIGGMPALEWAFFGADFVQRVATISSSAKYNANGVGWNQVLRQTLYLDDDFKGGRYDLSIPPVRAMAMVYRAVILLCRTEAFFQSLALLSGKCQQHDKAISYPSRSTSANLDRFLDPLANKLALRYDANCMHHLTHKLDGHNISQDRVQSIEVTALGQIEQPTLVVGVTSDCLFPFSDQVDLAQQIPKSHFVVLESHHGHETFLVEFEKMGRILQAFLSQSINEEALQQESVQFTHGGVFRSKL